MTDLENAYNLSKKLHSGQVDRAGKPYFNHIQRVFKSIRQKFPSDDSIAIVALLHDSVEDTSMSISKIEKMFGKEISQSINAITKRNNEEYSSYLRRVKRNKMARIVKLVDIKDNLNLDRLPNPGLEDFKRVEKYKRAIKYLK